MTAFQAVSIFFGFFMMYVIRIHFKKKHFDSFEFGMWLALWSGFIFLSIFPETIKGVSESLNIGRVFDAIVILAFMILSSLALANRIAIKKLEKKLQEKVQDKAINDANQK